MNLDIALLADAATVDAGGKLNILGAFHRLRGPSFPLRHGRISLVLRFAPERGDAGKMAVGIRLVGPEDQEVVRLDGEVAHRGGEIPDHARIPQVLNLDGIVFPTPGTYRFEVRVDGDEVGSVPLHVEEASRKDGGPGPGSGGGPTPIMVPPGSEGGVRA
jgi:hypothetical protein